MASETLMIVEEDATIRELLRYNFGREGYRIVECSSCDEAREQLSLSVPDLMLLEVLSPGSDGFTFCRAVRADERTSKLPVIVLTTRDGDADIVMGLEAGADDYMTKPFSTRDLSARVQALLRLRKEGTGDMQLPPQLAATLLP